MSDTIPKFYEQESLHIELYDVQTSYNWGKAHDDVTFYLEEAGKTGGPILELGCGTGRVSVPLARAGFVTHSLDLSVPMLNALESKRANLPSEVRDLLHLHHGDMSNFDLGKRFGLILVPFRSFQLLLTPQAQRACLECISRHLADGGRAILNLFDPCYDFLVSGAKTGGRSIEIVHPVSGNNAKVEVMDRVNDQMRQVASECWRFTEFAPDGTILRQEEERLSIRWTFRQEMLHLAELCGLKVEKEFSDFQRNPAAYAKEQILILKPLEEN